MDNDFCIFSFTKENYPRTLLLLVVVRMNKTYTLTFFFLWTALALIYHHEFLCAHQHSVDRESAINDYTIREKALKSNIFQFRNHKLSELVTNCNCLRRNGSPLDWGQEDSKSVSNRFQMASSVTHTFWQAAAYLTWYTLRGTSQVLIKRRAKWPAVELFWNSSQWRGQCTGTMLSPWDLISLDKMTLSLHLSTFSSLFLWVSLPMSQHLDTFGMERGDKVFPIPLFPQGAWVGLWASRSHDRDTSNPVRG